MERLMHIQNYLNGKTKQEVENAVVSGKIAFDKEKYRIVGSDAKLSGYVADFTDEYRMQMKSILGKGVYSSAVYAKMDDILADGFEYNRTDSVELYTCGNDIFHGTGKRKVNVYVFTKGEEKRELLVSRGDIVKGSLTMASRTSEFLEKKYEEVFNKQEYVADLFGVSKKLASYATTVLRNLEDDDFDKMVELFFEYSRQVMRRLSIRSGNTSSSFRYAFTVALTDDMQTECKKIIDTMFHFVGSNTEMLRMLKMFIGEGTAYSIKMTRDLAIAVMRKEIMEVISYGDIQSYREFIADLGEYDGGYTQDVSSITEITETEGEVIKFILDYGTRADFNQYIVSVVYDVKSKKLRETSLPKEVLDELYKSLKMSDEPKLPVPMKRANLVYGKIMKCGMDKGNKQRCIDSFIQLMSRGRTIRFNLSTFTNELLSDSAKTYNWKAKADLLCMVFDNAYSKQTLTDLLCSKHKLMTVTNEKFDAIIKKLDEFPNPVYEDIMSELKKQFGNCKVVDGKIEIDNMVYGVECRKTADMPQALLEIISDCLCEKNFNDICEELEAKIIGRGISNSYTEFGVTATIINADHECFITFTDGVRVVEKQMGPNSYEAYNEKIQLAAVADSVKKVYEDVLKITESKSLSNEEKRQALAGRFDLERLYQYSPDQILIWHINADRKVRLGSAKKSSKAEYLLGKNGFSIKVPELPKLQKAVRKAYCEMYSYSDMLTTNDGISADRMFTPCIYSLETNSFVNLSDAVCDASGSVYIGVEKLFSSDILKETMIKVEEDRAKSKEKLSEYRQLSSDSPEILWDMKMQFIEDAVKEHSISRGDLFSLLHDLWIKDDGIAWVKELLSSIDAYAVSDYKGYEKRLGGLKNPVMLHL